MSDLISRQAAIDELSQRYIIMDNPHYIGYNAGLDEAQKVIKALPPVYVPDTNVGETESSHESDTEITRCSDDTISRQAVIDLLKQMRKDGDMVPWEGKNVFARIRKLPSVQPTIMRSIGELVGYTGEPCPNCGRLRVERYKSGLEICEKCNWCEQTKSYWPD